jgi:glutaconyl-CoA/methylmalonyl-CoA decarboxylase subunit gamma
MKIRVKVRGKDFEVEVEDLAVRPVIAIINGERFEVWPEGDQDSTWEESKGARPLSDSPIQPPVKPAQPLDLSAGSPADIRAPIPGVILSIHVEEGNTVQAGDELCVLEAMKMKNILHAEQPARIKKIWISVGDSVIHNQLLMEVEALGLKE